MRFCLPIYFILLNMTAYSAVKTTDYTYDAFNRLKQFQLPNGVYATYHYDQYNRVIQLSNHVGPSKYQQIANFNYTYDSNNHLVKSIRTNQFEEHYEESYTYDANNRLSQYSCFGDLCPRTNNYQPINSEKYTYDTFNNIHTLILNGSTEKYSYDPSYPTRLLNTFYDKNGNKLKVGFTYNPFNQIRSVDTNGQRTNYVYYGDGTLAKQGNKHFIYGSQHLLNVNSTSYIYGDKGIGSQNTDGYNYYLSDLNDTVVNKIVFPNNGYSQAYEYSYSPYGNEVDRSVDPTETTEHYAFKGQLTDKVSGMQLLGNGYRAYSPEDRRFISQDSLSPFGKGGLNGYAFANNNPFNYTDPSGHFSMWENALLGFGVGLFLNVVTDEIGGWGSLFTNTIVGALLSNTETFDKLRHHKNISWRRVINLSVLGGTLGTIGGALGFEEYPSNYNSGVYSMEPIAAQTLIRDSASVTSNTDSNLFFIGVMRYNPLFDDTYADTPITIPKWEGPEKIRGVYFSEDFESSMHAEHIEMENIHTFGFGNTTHKAPSKIENRFTSTISRIKNKLFGNTRKDFDLQMDDFGWIDDLTWDDEF